MRNEDEALRELIENVMEERKSYLYFTYNGYKRSEHKKHNKDNLEGQKLLQELSEKLPGNTYYQGLYIQFEYPISDENRDNIHLKLLSCVAACQTVSSLKFVRVTGAIGTDSFKKTYQSNQCVEAIAELVAKNRNIKEIVFYENSKLSDADIKSLTLGLKSSAIERLEIQTQLDSISKYGYADIATLLISNTTLKNLKIKATLSEESLLELANGLKENVGLEELTFERVIIHSSDKVLKAFVDVFKINQSLRKIKGLFDSTQTFSFSIAKAFTKALKMNNSLIEIDSVSEYQFGTFSKSSFKKIKEYLERNRARAIQVNVHQGKDKKASSNSNLQDRLSDNRNISFLDKFRKQSISKPKYPSNSSKQEIEEAEKQNAPLSTNLPFSESIPYEKIQLGQKLGEGSFGIVYKATYLQADVAIKLLRQQTLTEKIKQEFIQEASLMATLRSPFIIQFYGICTAANHLGVVMEFMSRGSLFNLLQSKMVIEWVDRTKIAIDIGKGMIFLHENNIIHRDLKSLNILLDEKLQAKLCDFGLATVKSFTSSTMTNSIVGTLAWMAPELFKLKPEYSKKSDIYSYGMVLWEIASRKLPYMEAPNQEIIRQLVKEGERETIPSDTPKEISEIIQSCWQQESNKRPDANTIVETLKKLSFFATSPGQSGPQYISHLLSDMQLNNTQSQQPKSGPNYISTLGSKFK